MLVACFALQFVLWVSSCYGFTHLSCYLVLRIVQFTGSFFLLLDVKAHHRTAYTMAGILLRSQVQPCNCIHGPEVFDDGITHLTSQPENGKQMLKLLSQDALLRKQWLVAN